ncbi:GDSL esterase/lipase At4g26790 [Linum grandiflorum]
MVSLPKASMRMAMFLFLSIVHLLLQVQVQVLGVKGNIPSLIVFGDSTVDPGNNNHISTILKSDFEPYGRDFEGGKPTGRFSNGRIATDFIAEAFGIKSTIPAYLDPAYGVKDFATGVSFASAGTGLDNATSDVLSVIPLWKQLEYYEEFQGKLRGYLGNDKANEVLREALYLISIGTNDFLENYYMIPGKSSRYPIGDYQHFLLGIARNFITELHQRGVRKITITGLPPMGCLPLERARNILSGSYCVEEYNTVAKDFNKKLNEVVKDLNKKLPATKAVLSSPYDIVMEMIENPSHFGFKNAEKACCGTGLLEMSYMCNKRNPFTCSDASEYIFWDAFHPTEKTNKIVADYVFKHFLAIFK